MKYRKTAKCCKLILYAVCSRNWYQLALLVESFGTYTSHLLSAESVFLMSGSGLLPVTVFSPGTRTDPREQRRQMPLVINCINRMQPHRDQRAFTSLGSEHLLDSPFTSWSPPRSEPVPICILDQTVCWETHILLSLSPYLWLHNFKDFSTFIYLFINANIFIIPVPV